MKVGMVDLSILDSPISTDWKILHAGQYCGIALRLSCAFTTAPFLEISSDLFCAFLPLNLDIATFSLADFVRGFSSRADETNCRSQILREALFPLQTEFHSIHMMVPIPTRDPQGNAWVVEPIIGIISRTYQKARIIEELVDLSKMLKYSSKPSLLWLHRESWCIFDVHPSFGMYELNKITITVKTPLGDAKSVIIAAMEATTCDPS